MNWPFFAAIGLSRSRLAVLCGLTAAWLTACSGGGPAAQRDRTAAADEISTPTRYATALRLAALARVEARAGADELAAEHFRAAYRHHADAEFLRRYAEAAERAHLYAEARDATKRALVHPLAIEDRQRLEGDVVRLDKLVPAGVVRVAVQVRPDTARVVLTQGSVQRTVLGPGQIYLKAGAWGIETSAKGFQSELRTFQAGEGDGELLAIALHSEETGPALAEVPQRAGDPEPKNTIPEVEPEPQPRVVVKPEPKPEAKVVVKPEAKAEPVVVAPIEPRPPGRSAISKYGPALTSGLGLVALGVGGYFFYQAATNVSDLNALDATHMSSAQYAADFAAGKADAESNLQKADYLMAAGGAVLAAGLVWWVLAPSANASAAAAPAHPAPAVAALLPQNVALTHQSFALTWTF